MPNSLGMIFRDSLDKEYAFHNTIEKLEHRKMQKFVVIPRASRAASIAKLPRQATSARFVLHEGEPFALDFSFLITLQTW